MEVPDILIKVTVFFLFVQVTVNTNIIDLNEYLQHILKSTNMKCLTPEKVSPLPVDSLVTNFFVHVLFLHNLFSICYTFLLDMLVKKHKIVHITKVLNALK